jgi:hypothetical protein
MPASVTKVNAGFMAPGQTAKSFVGVVETSATVTVTQALETVTAKVLTEIGTITGKFTNGSKTVTAVTAASYANLEEGLIEFATGSGIAAGTLLSRATPEAVLAGTATSWADQVKKFELSLSETYTGATENKTVKVYKLASLGKTFYITDIYIATNEESGTKGAKMLDARIQAGGVDIFRAGVHNLSPVEMPGIETQPFATEGQAVTLSLPTTGVVQKVWFTIQGFEQ